jgi:hypothetical protein
MRANLVSVHVTARHYQCMRLTDHVTLNFNNKISTANVFLDIEKAFDTTWPLACYTSYQNWNFRPT